MTIPHFDLRKDNSIPKNAHLRGIHLTTGNNLFPCTGKMHFFQCMRLVYSSLWWSHDLLFRVYLTWFCVVQVECIMSILIYKNLVKGYFAHKSKVVVLSKQDPFPRLNGKPVNA